MSMTYQTGRLPHSPQQIANLQAKHRYAGSVATVSTVMQHVGRIRNQRSTPSCVGQACAAGIEALTGFDGSAIDLWIDARRRDGNLDRADEGTTAETAIESLIGRGLSPYEEGEESRESSAYTQMPDLSDELEADDNRLSPVTERFVVTGTVAAQRLAIVAALQAGEVVLWATGVKDPFFSIGYNVVADSNYVGANYNGHEMRVVGYDAITDQCIVQNSWGEGWGGCSHGTEDYAGCFRIGMRTLVESAWDTMILSLTPAGVE